MHFLLSTCDTNTIEGRKVRSLSTGNIGRVQPVANWKPNACCMKHDQVHTVTIEVHWENGNKSNHPLCDYDGVEIISETGVAVGR